MKIKERIRNYLANKSKLSIASDIFFILLIIAFIIPKSRMMLGTWVNRAKILVISPSVHSGDEAVQLKSSDLEIIFLDLSGEDNDLSELKNKVIFINFWATWCPPCVAEMSNIQKLYNRYKDNKDIKFYIVSNETQATVASFAKKKGYNLPFYTSRFKLPDAFAHKSIPTTFVISKSGKIVVKETGAANWNSETIHNLLDKLIKE